MKSKFTITDFSPPPQKKKRKLTMKEFVQLQKKKRGKVKILHLKKKKRGFSLTELSSPTVMRKKIKYNKSPPKNSSTAHQSQPRLTNTKFTIDDIHLSPKQTRQTNKEDIHLPPKQTRQTNTKEDIHLPPKQTRQTNKEDIHLPPKQTRQTNTKFTIDDIHSPKQSSSSSSRNKHDPISPTPCCACKRVMKEGDKAPDDCAWCQLKVHLHECTKKNATERKRETRNQMKSLRQSMKRHTI